MAATEIGGNITVNVSQALAAFKQVSDAARNASVSVSSAFSKVAVDVNVSKLLGSIQQAADAAKNASSKIQDAFKDKELSITINAALDASQAKADANALLQTVSSQFKNTVIKVPVHGDFSALASEVKAVGTALQGTVPPLKVDTKVNADGIKHVDKELKEASTSAKKLDNALEAVDKEAGSLGEKKISFGEKFKAGLEKGLGDGLLGSLATGNVEGIVAAGVQALGEGIKATIELGQEFESSLSSISVATGISGQGLTDIGNRARNLAKEFGGSAKEQLEIFQTTLGKVGPELARDSDALTTFSTNVNTLSKTDPALDAAGAVDALTGSLQQFGVNVSDTKNYAAESSRFMNVLAASAKVGSASVGEVAASIGVAGSSLSKANVSFEESTAAVQVLADTGLKGSEAGTALAAVVDKLQFVSGPAAAQLKAMGTSSVKLGELLTTNGIGAAVGELRGAMGKLGTDAEKNAFLIQAFGAKGAEAASALLEGGGKLTEFTQGVTGTQTAVEEAKTRMDTFAERISKVQSNIQDFGLEIFNSVAPVFKEIFSVLSDVFSQVSQALSPLINDIKENFGRMFEVVKPIYAILGGTIIGAVILLFGELTSRIRIVTGVLATLYERVSQSIAPIFERLGAIFNAVGGSTITLSDIISAFGSGLKIFGDIVISIGGFLIELLITPIEYVVSIVTDTIDQFSWLGKIFNSTSVEAKHLGKEVDTGGSFFTKLINIVKTIPNFFDGVTGAFRELKAVIGDAFEILKGFSVDNIYQQLAKLFDLFGSSGDRIGKKFNEAFEDSETAAGKAEKSVEKVGKAGEESAQKTADAYKRLSEKVGTLKVNAPNLSFKEVKDNAQEISGLLKKAKQDGFITDGDLKTLDKQLKAIVDSRREKKPKTDAGDVEFNNLQQQIKAAQQLADLAKDDQLQDSKKLANAEKRALTKKEETDAEQKGLDVLKEKADLILQNSQAVLDEKGRVIDIGVKIDPKNKQTLIDNLNKILKEVVNREYALNPKIKGEDLTKSITDALAELKNSTTDIPVHLIATTEDVTALKSEVQGKFADLTAKVTAKLNDSTDEEERKRLNEQLKKIAEEQAHLFKAIDKQVSDERKRQRDAEIQAIEDANVRKLTLEIQSLEQQKAKELEAVRGNGAAILRITADYDRQIAAKRDAIRQETDTLYGISVRFRTNIEKAFTAVVSEEERKRVKEKKQELDKQADDLLKSLKKGTISYQDYIDQLNQIDAQRASLDLTPKFNVDTLLFKPLNDAVRQTAQTLRQQFTDSAAAALQTAKNGQEARLALEKQAADLEAEIDKARASGKVEREKELQARLERLRANGGKTSEELAKHAAKLQGEISKAEKEGRVEDAEDLTAELSDTQKQQAADVEVTNSAIEDAYTNVLAAGAAATAQAIVTAENFGDASKTIAFDTLNSLVPIFVAEIFGSFFGSLGPIFGPIATAATTGILYGLVGIARAAAGAEEGVIGITAGYSKRAGKTDSIPLLVAPGEAIINAGATAQFRDTLLAINSGGNVLQSLFNDTTSAEIAALMRENYSLPERLAILGGDAPVLHEVARHVPGVSMPALTAIVNTVPVMPRPQIDGLTASGGMREMHHVAVMESMTNEIKGVAKEVKSMHRDLYEQGKKPLAITGGKLTADSGKINADFEKLRRRSIARG